MTQIDDLRTWRRQAIEAHMYETAALVGDKVLALSSHPDDAYWLAQAFYGMGEHLRGANLILDNFYEQESLKCRYIAALCLLQAQKLEKVLALLTTNYRELQPPLSGAQAASAPKLGPTSASPLHKPLTQLSPAANPPFGTSPTGLGVAATPFSASHPLTENPPFSAHAPAPPPFFPAEASPQTPPLLSQPQMLPRSRVISTSSLKAPTALGSRTLSGSSKVSMILPQFDEEDMESDVASSAAAKEELDGVYIDALLQFLLGRVYTLQSKFGLAKDAYIAALRIDTRCYDALAQLVKYHTLTPQEETELLDQLDFSRAGGDLGYSMYALRLTSAGPTQSRVDHASETLVETYMIPRSNADIAIAQAQTLLANGRTYEARQKLETVLDIDRYELRAYAPYAECLHALSDPNTLYRIAHELAESSPDNVVTWHVIGTYYLATQRVPEARAHFSKASMIDAGFAPSWIGFARTFADECEHEQAIIAFSTVARLFPGYYLPYVCIGMQHMHLFHLNLAEKYLATAAEMSEENPLVMNEIGVVFYHQNKLPRALQIFKYAYQTMTNGDPTRRSDLTHGNTISSSDGHQQTKLSILVNTGHTLRRMGKLVEAMDTFEKVSAVSPMDPALLTAMGLCLLQLEKHEAACEKLALALALAPDDGVANDLLKRATEMAASVFDVKAFAQLYPPHAKRQEVAFD